MTNSPSNSSSIILTTVAAGFGFALIQLDVTVVNVALPTLAHALDASLAGLQWVVDAYALTFAALLLTGGHFGDRYGAKRTYLAGLGIFAAASLICGLAPDATTLIAGRIAQGVGAAAMLPCSLTLINHAAEGHPARRAHAVGWWTAAGAITIAAGPIVGGLLLGVASWRSIFLVNLPVCLIGAVLTLKVDETDRPPLARGFDIPGQIFGILTLAGITAAVIEAKPLGLTSPVTLGCALVGFGAMIAFAYRECRTSEPMLPLTLFGSRTFSGAILYGAVVNFSYYGAVFVLSLYLQRVLSYSPTSAGLAFLPLTATFLVVNIVSGWWVSRVGSRRPMVIGAPISAAGFALLAFLVSEATSYRQLSIAFVLIPCGIGLGVPAMTTAVLASVERERSGIASAVLNAVRQAGGAMGVALFGALGGDAPEHLAAGLRSSALLATGLLLGVAAISAVTVATEPESAEAN